MDVFSYNFNNIDNVLKVVVASFTIIGVAYKVGRYVASKISQFYDRFTKVHLMIEHIYSELNTNHGTSLTDKINRIEVQLNENTRVTELIMYRQRWLLDSRGEPIFESDTNGLCTWVNTKYCALTGYTQEEFLNNGWHNVIHEADRDRIIHEWESAVKGKRDSHINYRIVTKQGETYQVTAVSTRNGELGYIGTIFIEEQKVISNNA